MTLPTLTLRPERVELLETPTRAVSDWRAGIVHGTYRDAGRRRLWRLVWHNASVGELAVYRLLWQQVVGGLNQGFRWRPPHELRDVVVRPVAPVRVSIVTGRSCSFEWVLEEHRAADPAPWRAPWFPYWAPLLIPGAS